MGLGGQSGPAHRRALPQISFKAPCQARPCCVLRVQLFSSLKEAALGGGEAKRLLGMGLHIWALQPRALRLHLCVEEGSKPPALCWRRALKLQLCQSRASLWSCCGAGAAAVEVEEPLNPEPSGQDWLQALELDHFWGEGSSGAPAALLRIASLENRDGGLTPNGYRCLSKLSQAFCDYWRLNSPETGSSPVAATAVSPHPSQHRNTFLQVSLI